MSMNVVVANTEQILKRQEIIMGKFDQMHTLLDQMNTTIEAEKQQGQEIKTLVGELRQEIADLRQTIEDGDAAAIAELEGRIEAKIGKIEGIIEDE
jgi:chromosome segregation ATPase